VRHVAAVLVTVPDAQTAFRPAGARDQQHPDTVQHAIGQMRRGRLQVQVRARRPAGGDAVGGQQGTLGLFGQRFGWAYRGGVAALAAHRRGGVRVGDRWVDRARGTGRIGERLAVRAGARVTRPGRGYRPVQPAALQPWPCATTSFDERAGGLPAGVAPSGRTVQLASTTTITNGAARRSADAIVHRLGMTLTYQTA
jgi:hypothetical protein